MQAMNATAATAATAAAATSAPLDGVSDIAGQQTGAANIPAAVATDSGAPSVKVSLSAAAQAYLSQPDPPSIAETQRAKKKPKMKTLLDLMLEWGRKYQEQRDQQQQDKQLAVQQGLPPSSAALTANSPKKVPPGQFDLETTGA